MPSPKPLERAEAFRLYCAGTQQKDIATQLGVATKTLTKWSRADNWKTRRALQRETATVVAASKALGKQWHTNHSQARRAKMPPWAAHLLELLTTQQQTLARLEAHLLPPAS